jgi:hypothetical protein
METWRRGDMELWSPGNMKTWRHRYMDMETSNRKQKPRQFSLIRLPYSHRANRSLSFVRLLLIKQTG